MSKRKNRLSDNDINEESKARNMTYYDVLGVSKDAGLSEIKKQFRILAIKYHPDQRETGDASIFALVARAYECLSNDRKRDEYDRMLAIERKARKSDFTSQKKAFEEFIKAQDNEISSKGIEHAKSKFRLDWEDMDRKKRYKNIW
jgi:DnaJ-class molecular chaperone